MEVSSQVRGLDTAEIRKVRRKVVYPATKEFRDTGKGTAKIRIRPRKDCETRHARPRDVEQPKLPRERW